MTYSRTKNKKAIQDTFNCVGNYGTEHGIKFNPAKCELITFNNNMKKQTVKPTKICGKSQSQSIKFKFPKPSQSVV